MTRQVDSIARSHARQAKADPVLQLLPAEKIRRDGSCRFNGLGAGRPLLMMPFRPARSTREVDAYSLSPAISMRPGHPSIESVEASQPSWQRSVGLGLVARGGDANAIRRRNGPVRAFARWLFHFLRRPFVPRMNSFRSRCCREAPARLRRDRRGIHQSTSQTARRRFQPAG